MTDFIVAMVNSDTLQEILPVGYNPMKATVRETSKLTSWPVEDGTERTDHRVLDPIEIELPLLISSEQNRDIFDRLRQAYLRGDSIMVQTRVRTYENMMIIEIPHDETPDIFNSVPVSVRLKEVRTVEPEFGTLPASKVANANQSSTVKKGAQQTTDATAAETGQASLLYDLVN